MSTIKNFEVIFPKPLGLQENIEAGTVIATITKEEISNPNVHYDLLGDDAGLFEIVGYDIRLKEGAVIDFELNPVVTLSVLASDSSSDDGIIINHIINKINLQEKELEPKSIAELLNSGVVVVEQLSIDDMTNAVSYLLSGEDEKLREILDVNEIDGSLSNDTLDGVGETEWVIKRRKIYMEELGLTVLMANLAENIIHPK